MIPVFFDGVECRSMEGKLLKLGSLTKDDILLVVETDVKVFMDFNEIEVQKEESKLQEGGDCAVRYKSDVGASVFSMPQKHHDAIRTESSVRVIDAGLAIATAMQCRAIETLVVVNRYGEFVYLSLWLDGNPVENHWLVGTMIGHEMDAFRDIIAARMATTNLRIGTNYEASFFDKWIEEISEIVTDLNIKIDYFENDDLAAKILGVRDTSEYITDDEYSLRLRKKERVRAVISIIMLLSISAPGMAMGAYSLFNKHQLESELSSAESIKMDLIKSVSMANRDTGGSVYYGVSNLFINASEQLIMDGFNKGTVERSIDGKGFIFSATKLTDSVKSYDSHGILDVTSSQPYLKNGKSFIKIFGKVKGDSK